MVCTPLAEITGGNIKIYARDVVTLVQAVRNPAAYKKLAGNEEIAGWYFRIASLDR
jgi:hypothetical protein